MILINPDVLKNKKIVDVIDHGKHEICLVLEDGIQIVISRLTYLEETSTIGETR